MFTPVRVVQSRDKYEIRNTKYEIFIASGTNIKYMETTCNKSAKGAG